MTNKDAINRITEIIEEVKLCGVEQGNKDIEALKMAVQALRVREQQELLTQLPNGTVYAPELYQGCLSCDAHNRCLDAFCSNSINCNAYGKEDVK